MFSKSHKVLQIILILFMFTILSSCGQSESDIKVGLLAVTSGESYRVGNYIATGARLAADCMNDAGGIIVDGQKHKLRLILKDSGGTAELAAKRAENLIVKNKVKAIVGGASSEVALAIAEVCEKYEIPFITPVAGTTKLTPLLYSFRVSYTNAVLAKGLALFMVNDLPNLNAAVLYEGGNPYSSELGKLFKKEFEKHKGKIVACESYDFISRDFESQLKTIISKNPDVLFLPNVTKQVQLQVKQARELGFKGIFLGGDSWDSIELHENKLFENSYFADQWLPGILSKSSRKFEASYNKKFSTIPSEVEALSFDAVKALAKAIEEADSIQPKDIHEGFIKMSVYRGVTGDMKFDNNGDPDKDVFISKITKDGVILKDIMFAE